MEIDNLTALQLRNKLLTDIKNAKEVVWINSNHVPYADAMGNCQFGRSEVFDAIARLKHFAPLIQTLFPETASNGGIIESELVDIPKMHQKLNSECYSELEGQLYIKLDSHLPISGSVKARGGVYEVLKYAETLALKNDIIDDEDDDYLKLLSPEAKSIFTKYTIHVASTGNLGLSVGIMSTALGFKATVHMSADARQWKKDLLRQQGATVIEYECDYTEAVLNGRQKAKNDEYSYFVDDEYSEDLFFGYSVGGRRLQKQLKNNNIVVDEHHPLFVYIPCGVGGAPAGIMFGLKQCFGDNVHCFFVEPTQAPCVLLGFATGLYRNISVQDIGLSGLTEADGLAVSRQSAFAAPLIRPFLSGDFTIDDSHLFKYMHDLWSTEKIFIEPSAAAAFQGPAVLMTSEAGRSYLQSHGLIDKMEKATHIVWATGGNMVPEAKRENYLKLATDATNHN